MVRPKGSVTFVHRADRIDALLGCLAGRAGGVVVFPLWPAAGRDAGRVLVRARKQVAAPARLAAGLVLHEADGRFTAAAEAVLRGGEALSLIAVQPRQRARRLRLAAAIIPICGIAMNLP